MKRRTAGRAALSALLLVLAAATALAPPAAAITVLPSSTPERPPGRTLVSLTFDDGFRSQEVAARVLADQGMAGTFYVNASSLGYPAYLTVEQLRTIVGEGHEVGGHGLDHEGLTGLSPQEARRQVCDDRATLAALGFEPRSFAYPYSAYSPEVRRTVQDCGYGSARTSSGLYDSPGECGSCPRAEDPAAMDTWRIRTSGTSVDPAVLRSRVQEAETSGGGWVPLVFHSVCTCPEKAETAISPADFAAFVDWLAARPGSTTVATVAQVSGAQLRPVVGTPLERLVPPPGGVRERNVAFTVAGLPITQSNVIASGLLLAAGAMVTYRVGTRGKRYDRSPR